MASVFRAGATALITGGASGVGFAFAQLCRKHGMHLALVDINTSNLDKAKAVLHSSKANEKTETYAMDVSQLAQWEKLKSDVESTFGGVDLLILNAGAAPPAKDGNQWADVESFQKTFAINIFGMLNGIATFLPVVQKNKDASAIIMTGSKQGITNPPGRPAYNASKSAVKTLAEHLSHDLRSSNPNVSVHLLIPGWAYTGLSGNSGPVPDDEARKTKPQGAWLPSQVAEYGYKKMNEGKFYIFCPDNDVTEELDQARMTWGAGDWIDGRSALSRWDPKWKDRSAEWIKSEAERRASSK